MTATISRREPDPTRSKLASLLAQEAADGVQALFRGCAAETKTARVEAWLEALRDVHMEDDPARTVSFCGKLAEPAGRLINPSKFAAGHALFRKAVAA